MSNWTEVLVNSFSQKSIFLLLILLMMVLSPVSAASKKKKKADEVVEPVKTEIQAVETSVGLSEESVKLPSQKRTYFYKIEQDIIEDVEKGTPESIRSAMSKIRKNTSEYDEREQVLIVVASEIMNIIWPSEKYNWDVPVAVDDNPYIGAINSVNQGVFDSSTGDVDFLSTVLPAMVLVKSNYNDSMYDSCHQALSKALSMNSQSVLAGYLMGLLYEKKGEFEQAEPYFKSAYEISPDTKEIALAYVGILRNVGNQQLAYEVLNKIENATDDITVLQQNAYIAFELNNLQAAELYVAKVLQQNPNNLEFVLLRARILMEKNDYIHAVSLLDMYARQGGISIDYLVLRAKVQLDWSKNTSAATETVEKALQLYPDNKDALMFAARISSITDSPVAGKYADELAVILLEKDPENQTALLYAFRGLLQRKNWAEAYLVGKKIISYSNESAEKNTAIAVTEIIEDYVTVCINLGKEKEAYDFAKKQLDENPKNEAVLQAYVLAYSKTGTRTEVMKYIESLMVGASAKMKSYLYYRRSFLQPLEDNILADLRSSLTSNPRNSDALFRLYEMYYAKKDYRKAQYYLRQVVAINPNDNSVKQLNESLTKLIQ